MILASVVLPHPVGPTMATCSPACSFRSISFNTHGPPSAYRKLTLSRWISGGAQPLESNCSGKVPAVFSGSVSTMSDSLSTCSRSMRIDIMLRSEEHTSELQSHLNLVCRLLLEKKKISEPTGNTYD